MKSSYLRHLYCFLILTLFTFTVSAQTWAPIGAKWWYDQISSSWPLNTTYRTVEIVKDSMITGDSIKIAEIFFHTKDTSILKERFFLKEDQGKIYYKLGNITEYPLSIGINEFRLLYDFSANVADTITIKFPIKTLGDSISLVVDSISNIIINGKPHNKYYLSPIDSINPSHLEFEGSFIENIGWTGYFFPRSRIADPPTGGPLRCYSDTSIGLYKHSNRECEYLFTSVESLIENFDIRVTYHPIAKSLQIYIENQEYSYRLIDFFGRVVLHSKGFGLSEINLNSISIGIYIVQIKINNLIYSHKLLLK